MRDTLFLGRTTDEEAKELFVSVYDQAGNLRFFGEASEILSELLTDANVILDSLQSNDNILGPFLAGCHSLDGLEDRAIRHKLAHKLFEYSRTPDLPPAQYAISRARFVRSQYKRLVEIIREGGGHAPSS